MSGSDWGINMDAGDTRILLAGTRRGTILLTLDEGSGVNIHFDVAVNAPLPPSTVADLVLDGADLPNRTISLSAQTIVIKALVPTTGKFRVPGT